MMTSNGGVENDSGECYTMVDEITNVINREEDGFHELYLMLNSIEANVYQLAENCCGVYDRLNELEIDCIDLLQPIGDIISLERELKQLSEVESNYMNMLKENENN